MLSSLLDALLNLSKTTFPQKLLRPDCITLYVLLDEVDECGGVGPVPRVDQLGAHRLASQRLHTFIISKVVCPNFGHPALNLSFTKYKF